MAKGKGDTKKVAETKSLTEKERLYAEIEGLVAKYNECKEFNETDEMQKLDEKMKEKIAEYDVLAETEVFNELLAQKDPMAAAARKLRRPTITVRDPKEKGVTLPRVLEDTFRPIDILRLHKRRNAGIGVDPLWMHKVANLQVLIVAAIAESIGKDAQTVKDGIKMSEQARKVKLDGSNGTECLTSVIKSMIPVKKDFEATDAQWAFVYNANTKAGKDGRSLVTINPATMRFVVLGILHDVLTGEGFDIICKKV